MGYLWFWDYFEELDPGELRSQSGELPQNQGATPVICMMIVRFICRSALGCFVWLLQSLVCFGWVMGRQVGVFPVADF